MKLQILSDLHLEHCHFFTPVETMADVIVLAGDIHSGANGIGWAREQFPGKQIIYVSGNHEMYGRQRLDTLAELRIEARKCGVHFLDDDEVVIDGEHDSVRFLGTTLWTDFDLFGEEEKPWAMKEGQHFLNDFRVIHEGEKGHFSPGRSVELHKESLAWLQQKLAEPFDGKTVVVSHHLPSKRSVAERFKKSLLSACFASDLDHLFGKMDCWIHGHTHDNFDYIENGTRVVCNPKGYETYSGTENSQFNAGLVVEV